MLVPRQLSPRYLLVSILFIAAATIGGALYFEHFLHFKPCKLCLIERYPYYAGLVVASLMLPLRTESFGFKAGASALILVFAVSAVLGVYHAGIEWGFFLGPSDCGGVAPSSLDTANLLRSLQTIRVVSCSEAAWRFFGLSLAGLNAVISILLLPMSFGILLNRFPRFSPHEVG